MSKNQNSKKLSPKNFKEKYNKIKILLKENKTNISFKYLKKYINNI